MHILNKMGFFIILAATLTNALNASEEHPITSKPPTSMQLLNGVVTLRTAGFSHNDLMKFKDWRERIPTWLESPQCDPLLKKSLEQFWLDLHNFNIEALKKRWLPLNSPLDVNDGQGNAAFRAAVMGNDKAIQWLADNGANTATTGVIVSPRKL